MKKLEILVVEDHKDIAEVIFDYFEHDYELDYAATGKQGLELAAANQYDCILLDLMLPEINGLTICKSVREAGISTPIIMLTAMDANQDIATGLNVGADDYVVKPFDLEVLNARIQAVTRRSHGPAFKKKLTVGELVLDTASHTVRRNQTLLDLTPIGFQILKLLMESYPDVATKQQIEQTIWQDALPDNDVLRKHIYQLRNKVDKPFNSELIVNVPKHGYKIGG